MSNSIGTQFSSDMARFITKAKGRLQAVSKESLIEIGRRLVDRSPVGDPPTWHPPYWPKGYTPGHFKNNWQVGIDTVPAGEISGSDASGQSSLERLSRLGRWPVGHVYYFANNVPYALRIENGWSYKQAPQGVVGLTVIEFPQIVRDAALRIK